MIINVSIIFLAVYITRFLILYVFVRDILSFPLIFRVVLAFQVCYFSKKSSCTFFRSDCPFRYIVGLYFVFEVVLNSTTLSDCTPFSGRNTLSTTLSRLTHNVPAAWRSGGFHYRLCGRQTFISVLPFQRG